MSTSFESRLTSAVKILDPYLQKAKVQVDSKSFIIQTLNSMGIDDSEIGQETLNAESTTLDDFKKVIDPTIISSIPEPRLKLAWSSLKSKEDQNAKEFATSGNSAFTTLIQTIKPIGQWGDFELLEKYGRECPVEIEEELKKRSKGRNCIVFFEDGTLDVENTLYVFRKARYQETPSTFMFKDKIKQVFKVGEFPLDVLFECPIHKNVLLVDGYCEECAMTWETKDVEKLALLRLIKEGTTSDPLMYREMSFEQLAKTFPKIYIRFQELKDEDKLPSLKRRISRVKDGDPFRVSTHRTF